MSFRDVLGHSRPIEMLRRAIERNKIAHSYLFLGKEGIGKKLVALQLAKALNCLTDKVERSEACDHCPSCRKIDRRLHPDVLVLEPEGETVKADQVRQMQRDLAYRPYEGNYRICILAGADRMAPNMSNILLKVLEEPPRQTVIILLANNARLLLPTILSRCQTVRFHPLPLSTLARWLTEAKGLTQQKASLLASLSEGSPGKALEIQEELNRVPRENLLRNFLGVKKFSLSEIESWSASLPSEREDLLLFLEVAKTLMRDLVMVKTVGGQPHMIHSDLSREIEETAATSTSAALLKRMELLHQTAMAIRAYANTRLALEAMMLSWPEG